MENGEAGTIRIKQSEFTGNHWTEATCSKVEIRSLMSNENSDETNLLSTAPPISSTGVG